MANTNCKQTPRTESILARELMGADGQWQTVGSIVAEMQAAGTKQVLIDRWLQGLSYER